jgi:tetratricopeptide (TPR) repeat protein
MTIETFLETAWNDHADRPQEVADRLTASLHWVQTPEDVPPYARLVTHVFGDHLGQWDRGVDLLEALRRLPACDDGPAAAGAVTRGVATLRYAGGDSAALESLSVEERVSALAGAASAFTGRNAFAQALAAYSEALRLGDAGLPAGSPAIRALAVGGNNLAAALEEKKDRDSGETRGMIAAAEAGLKYWKQAGTWLEEERAEYRFARSLLQAGEYAAAIQSALRCIAVCERNNAPAFERFFGYAALALAHRKAGDLRSFEVARKQALQLLEQVPQEERQWCESDRNELGP